MHFLRPRFMIDKGIMDNTQTQGGALHPKAGYHRKGVVKSDLIAFVILLVLGLLLHSGV